MLFRSRRLDGASPIVDATLPDGTRLNAVLPPLSAEGTLICLRTGRRRAFTLGELVGAGTIAPGLDVVLAALVERRANCLVTGATGTGKTTLLAALLGLVAHTERIVCIEEASELRPDHPHVIHLQERGGANPAPFAFGELYMALKQGQFDGQENPITNIYYSKIYEVQKYLSLSNHKYETCPLVISMVTWNRLPKEFKEIIKSSAMEFAQKHRKLNTQTNSELLAELEKNGVIVNSVNVETMRKATQSVYTDCWSCCC